MAPDELAHEPSSLREKRATARLQSTEILRRLILDGELASGQRLNEVDLAARFDMSRGPLRESLQRLAAEGLVTIVSHRGSFVRTFTAGDLSDLYEVRSILETAACRLAAGRRTDADLRRVSDLLARTEQTLATEPAYPSDQDFHLGILSMVHNDVLVAQAKDLLAQLRLARSRSAHSSTRAKSAFREHVEILEAIRAGRHEAAAEAMRAHLARSCRSAQSAFEAVLASDDRLAGQSR